MNQPAIEAPSVAKKDDNKRLGYLDSYRGIACLMVYFYHTAVNISFFGVPFPGYYGVHLFFVLSGYLMSGKFLPALSEGEAMPSLRKYLVRRFLRIYPPYLLCLTVFVVLRHFSHTKAIGWKNIFLHAGLIFNYVDSYDYYSINAVFWSLAVEIQFYLILPIVVWLILRLCSASDKRMFWFGLSFLCVGILSRAFEFHFINHENAGAVTHVRFKWVTSHLDLFGCGILLRAIEWKADAEKRWLNSSAAWGGIALTVAIFFVVAVWSKKSGAWQESNDFWFVALCPPLACMGFACLLASTSLSSLRQNALFRWKFLQWIGLISYSFYLYHIGVLFAFNQLVKPEKWGLSWEITTLMTGVICLPATIFIAWAAYHLFEKPFFKSA